MQLTKEELNTIQGLLNYLAESFDGHGLVATVDLSDVNDADKGRIAIQDRIETNFETSFMYAWESGD